jgi:hypothetical protein
LIRQILLLATGFLLSQPFGRIPAWFRKGWPQGVLKLLFILELLAGIAIRLVRPSM